MFKIDACPQRSCSSLPYRQGLARERLFQMVKQLRRAGLLKLNLFRGDIIKAVIAPIFAAALEDLIELGYLWREHYFVKGKVRGERKET